MTTVAEILKSKTASSVFRIAPDATVYDALRLMAERDIGALLVMEQERVVGIFTERDYARKIVLMGRASVDTPVRDVMTRQVLFVEPGQSGEECMQLMTRRRLRHLPVMQEGRLLGLVSIGDLVKSIISQQQFVIEQLEHYITGGGR